MLNLFKPQLAIDIAKVKSMPSHLMASVKLDGIRAICFDGVFYSRSLKKIPNACIQKWAWENREVLEGLDGELIVGAPNAKDVYNKTTSAVMSHDGEPNFIFHVFDIVREDTYKLPYSVRYSILISQIKHIDGLSILPHTDITESELEDYESKALERGYEGIMLRDSKAPYKFGRSGTKNPEIMKVKRFTDAEFEVIGYENEWLNNNTAETNELGRTQRSTSKDGLVAKDSLGSLLLRDPKTKVIFSCGSGFTKEQRSSLWAEREELIGKLAKVKYFEVGMQDAPRFPVWIGFRHKEDM